MRRSRVPKIGQFGVLRANAPVVLEADRDKEYKSSSDAGPALHGEFSKLEAAHWRLLVARRDQRIQIHRVSQPFQVVELAVRAVRPTMLGEQRNLNQKLAHLQPIPVLQSLPLDLAAIDVRLVRTSKVLHEESVGVVPQGSVRP